MASELWELVPGGAGVWSKCHQTRQKLCALSWPSHEHHITSLQVICVICKCTMMPVQTHKNVQQRLWKRVWECILKRPHLLHCVHWPLSLSLLTHSAACYPVSVAWFVGFILPLTGIKAVSSLWLFWVPLQWTCAHKSLHMWLPFLGWMPRVQLLGHMAVNI